MYGIALGLHSKNHLSSSIRFEARIFSFQLYFQTVHILALKIHILHTLNVFANMLKRFGTSRCMTSVSKQKLQAVPKNLASIITLRLVGRRSNCTDGLDNLANFTRNIWRIICRLKKYGSAERGKLQ